MDVAMIDFLRHCDRALSRAAHRLDTRIRGYSTQGGTFDVHA